MEKTLALPQLQLVEKSDSFYDPSYLAVTCLVFAFGVQVYGLFWEKLPDMPYSALLGLTVATSVYVVVFLAGSDAPRAVFPCLSAFRRRQQWQYTACFTGDEARPLYLAPLVLYVSPDDDFRKCSLFVVCLLQQWIQVHASDYGGWFLLVTFTSRRALFPV